MRVYHIYVSKRLNIMHKCLRKESGRRTVGRERVRTLDCLRRETFFLYIIIFCLFDFERPISTWFDFIWALLLFMLTWILIIYVNNIIIKKQSFNTC